MEQVISFLKKITIAIIIFDLCTCIRAHGECASKVSPIKQGQVATCDGYLFSPDAEEEAYKAKQLVNLYKSENQILEERLQLYMKQSDVLAKDVAQRDNMENLYRIGYFSLGALLTGFIVANVKR